MYDVGFYSEGVFRVDGKVRLWKMKLEAMDDIVVWHTCKIEYPMIRFHLYKTEFEW